MGKTGILKEFEKLLYYNWIADPCQLILRVQISLIITLLHILERGYIIWTPESEKAFLSKFHGIISGETKQWPSKSIRFQPFQPLNPYCPSFPL